MTFRRVQNKHSPWHISDHKYKSTWNLIFVSFVSEDLLMGGRSCWCISVGAGFGVLTTCIDTAN